MSIAAEKAASRAMEACVPGPSSTLATIPTSITMIDRVRMIVPTGSPSRRESASARRFTSKEA
ncbi:hypothetical protein CYK24_04495 [Trueperella bernardiae]|nr:hypothetical protein CYK24_04495 [Trueperella bernardiae]